VRSTDASDGRAVVILAFEQPLEAGAYPLDVCAIDTGGQPITGLTWLIDDDQVAAVSPRWGSSLTCLP
jgi:hypothetical protein